MPLQHLGSVPAALSWLVQRGARGVATDSRQLSAGDAFIAWPGQAHDARHHVQAALAAGAAACVVEAAGADAFAFNDPRIAAMDDLKAMTGVLAAAFFGSPSDRMSVVAITGTNGKTSTAWWTAQALSALGRRCGVIGTLGVGAVPLVLAGKPFAEPAPTLTSTGLTTPDPVTLQRAFRQFADDGYAACAIEASSIGLVEQRLSGTHIDVAVFTNFTQDHLDFHGSMDAYWQAKAGLFDWPALRAVVLNLDDPRGAELHRAALKKGLDAWTYSVVKDLAPTPSTAPGAARLSAQALRYLEGGMAFELVEAGQPPVPMRTRLIGDYNVSNLLAVLATLRASDITLPDAVRACAALTAVPGRMERVLLAAPAAGGAVPDVLVDYAHTPDALDKALRALQPLATARGGALWCVFGCGGNRDASKRPLMGAVAAQLAQHVVVTSDNPRDEAPAAITAAIVGGMVGLAAPQVIDDRRAAIAYAVRHAAARDVVLIAGKGHEDYQEIAGLRQPFNDVREAAAGLAARSAVSTQPTMATLGDLRALLPSATWFGSPNTDANTNADIDITRVHTDTRTLQPGDLFVALRGEHFDAHDFLPQAQTHGAAAVLAERGVADAGVPGLQVSDSREALGTLAAAWRQQFSLPLIAVTGSNGKTTVTQMLASILRAGFGDAALATAGNFNNDIGVPLTLLRLRHAQHRIAVVELGMNHPGEIARLAAMAGPTVALVNNAQREHLEFMHSVDAVAAENGSVISALAADGVAVFPAGDAYTPLWRSLAAGRRVVTFALGVEHAATASADIAADVSANTSADASADVTAHATWRADAADGDHWAVALRTPAGSAAFALRVAGRHNVSNALAAAACALAAGCSLDVVVRGLAAFNAVKGRSQAASFERAGVRVTLIDDSYNANPDSVRAAIDALAALPAPRWLLLGDMGEVGDQGPAFHREVGAYARTAGIDALWTAGPLCTHAAQAFGSARHFDTVGGLLAVLDESPAAASVLVKGSRFMKMEQVVAALRDHAMSTAASAAASVGTPVGALETRGTHAA
jgi:MurE/MurF fusion protein